MIYGWNFNGTPIPDEVKKRFRERLRLEGEDRVWVRLVGVCDSETDCNLMLIQAYNGHRLLHKETRRIGQVDWFGIYAS